jgi:WD40 repeat protein
MAKRSKSKKQLVLPPGVKLVRTLEGHQSEVFSLAFDPHGGMLASGRIDGTVMLWEARSGNLPRTLKGHQCAVYSVCTPTSARTRILYHRFRSKS